MGDEDEDWKAATLLIREVCMLKLMEDITNKPNWWEKVHDPEIAARWKAEALAMDWPAYLEHADFTENMADYCLGELREKAAIYEKTGLIPVIDYSACAMKSDSLMDEDLRQALLAGVKPLEDVPEEQRDWHPGSDGKVLDLVHPSLYPLVYGRSHVVPDRVIGVDDAIASAGQGVVVPASTELRKPHVRVFSRDATSSPIVSNSFQWLPCNVAISPDGAATIQSYINNLHPEEHKGLYPIIERFIAKALPAWDVIYRWPEDFAMQRLTTKRVGTRCLTKEICNGHDCRPTLRPIEEDEDERREWEEDETDYPESERGKRDHAWFMRTHPVKLPDMPKAAGGAADDDGEEKKEEDSDSEEDNNDDDVGKRPRHIWFEAEDVKTKGFFNDAKQVQVIVKLANIHLTPDKPSYDGGSWHTEGQLNEHICATALFYYDSDNITDCHLDFRTKANEEDMMMELSYAQSDHDAIQRTFNIDSQSHTLQDVGSVLTRPGRALFFPNLFQHHVSPFRLADPSRPGHRKILALFLVDPVTPVLSTANVPPQRKDWWLRAMGFDKSSGRLPPEVTGMVVKNLDFLIDEAEAKKMREELMEERKVLLGDLDFELKRVEWNFCEH